LSKKRPHLSPLPNFPISDYKEGKMKKGIIILIIEMILNILNKEDDSEWVS